MTEKNKILPVFLFAIFLSARINAQTPQGINYQAVARNGSGNIMANKLNMKVRATLFDVNNTLQYQEEHTPVATNSFGLFTIIIGKGTILSGAFPAFSAGNPFSLKIEVDTNGASGYINMGITQFQSVPYALYAPGNISVVTGTSPVTVTGPINLPNISLQNSGVTAGSYGGSFPVTVPTFSVDALGRIISAGTYTINITAGSYVPSTRSITITSANANQVIVSGGLQDLSSDRTWILSTPQDIHPNALPTFSGLQLTGLAPNSLIQTDSNSVLKAIVPPFSVLNQFLSWNGINYIWATASGSTTAITSLNGLTNSSQTFSVSVNPFFFGFTSFGSVHTLNIPTAHNILNIPGLLTSTDWNTFNNKITSANAPLTLSGITSPTVSLSPSGVMPAIYGTSFPVTIPTFVVDTFGRVTSAATYTLSYFWTRSGSTLFTTNTSVLVGIGNPTPAYALDVSTTGVSAPNNVLALRTNGGNSNINVDAFPTGAGALQFSTMSGNGGIIFNPGFIGATVAFANNGCVSIGPGLNSKSTLGVRGGVAIGSTYPATYSVSANNVIIEGNMGIGTYTPSATLQVIGSIKTNSLTISPGAGIGNVLTSDANGNGTWQPSSNFNTGFSAYLSNTFSVSTGSFITVPFNIDGYDPGGHYSNATFKYSPPSPGLYHFDASISWTSCQTGSYSIYLNISGTNGKGVNYTVPSPGIGPFSNSISADVILIATDIVSIVVNQGSGITLNMNGSVAPPIFTWFSGHKVY